MCIVRFWACALEVGISTFFMKMPIKFSMESLQSNNVYLCTYMGTLHSVCHHIQTDTLSKKIKISPNITFISKGSMFSNCIPKENYSQMKNQRNECENENCLNCLAKELNEENWQKNPENILLKIAYEKRIIRNIASSISDLNQDDKKNLELVLYLCNMETYAL